MKPTIQPINFLSVKKNSPKLVSCQNNSGQT